MTSSKNILSPEYALLGLLAQQPAHGYDLYQKLVTDLGQIWHISQSQVYNVLNRLEEQKLIKGKTQEQSKLPARRIFQITTEGRRRFESWFHVSSGTSVRAIRVEFFTRLYFAQARDPKIAAQLLEAQLAETGQGLTQLKNMLADSPDDQIFNRLGLELRIHQLASISDWLATCQKILGVKKKASTRK